MSSHTGRNRLLSTSILVLWCQRCDEIAAVTFVSLLRQAGKRVKLVGLEGRNCVGRSGIALKADLLLDEVVRQPEQPSALIVPFEMTILQRFARNPWQGQLWQMLQPRCWVTPTESQPLLQTLISSPANTPADYHIHTYQHTSTASAELEELVATLLNELG